MWNFPYLSHNFHIRGTSPIARSHGINNPQNIPLHHSHKLEMVFAPRHVAQLLDEEHDVGAIVHVVLRRGNQLSGAREQQKLWLMLHYLF